MSTEQITQEAIDLTLLERVSLVQRLRESIEYGLADADKKSAIAEAAGRDDELTTAAVVGREHGEVVRTAQI